MKGAAVPILSAAIVVLTCAMAVASRGERTTHGFPDATKRPPLRIILRDAAAKQPSDRLMAARILGYYRSDAALQALEELLRDRDPLVRLAALRGVLLRNHPRSVAILEKVAADDPEELVRHRGEIYVEMLRDPLGNLTTD